VSRVVPEPARALVEQGELPAPVDRFGQTALPDPAAQADLKPTPARRYAARRQREAAPAARRAWGDLASARPTA
jgi:hypothetical protein